MCLNSRFDKSHKVRLRSHDFAMTIVCLNGNLYLRRYFLFLVFNVFLLSTFAGGLFEGLQEVTIQVAIPFACFACAWNEDSLAPYYHISHTHINHIHTYMRPNILTNQICCD